MNCPYCNQEIMPGNRFCQNCGAKLIQDSNTNPGMNPQSFNNGRGQNGQYPQMNAPQAQGGQQGQPYYQSPPQRGQQGQPYYQSPPQGGQQGMPYYQSPPPSSNNYNNGNKKRKKKKGGLGRFIPIVICGIIAIVLLGALFSDSDENSQEKEQVTSEEKAITETEETVESQAEAENIEESQDQGVIEEEPSDTENIVEEETRDPAELDFSAAREELENGGYAYITLEDMSRYIVNMTGQRIYTVITADNVDSDKIQADIDDGVMYQTFKTPIDYSEYFHEGDVVAVFGTVGETESLFGADWTNVVDSQVFAYGEEAEAYKKDATDESLSGYLVLTEEVANSEGKNNISEDEFKSLCEYYSYEDILRNPDSYKKKYAVLSGTVDQSVEGVFGLYTTLYITDVNGDKWDCTINYKEGQSHILEGDYVTLYGILNGTSTATTVLGKQVTMPSLQVEYVD